FYTATPADYVVAVAVAAALSAIGGALAPHLGLFIALILGLPAGGLISELVMRAIGRRRGRYLWAYVAGGIVIGALLGAWLFDPSLREALALYLQPGAGEFQVDPRSQAFLGQFIGSRALPLLLFIALSAGAVIARMRSR
ncbi:MAG TPA: hypothetical protein VMT34_05900, partial [Aggregatilineales bacterium]|nr:hypothetical protein [Aggregatilineales bacterium]